MFLPNILKVFQISIDVIYFVFVSGGKKKSKAIKDLIILKLLL